MTIYIVVGRGPLPGPETELVSNTQKWIVQGDTCWQSKKFYWGRAPGWRTVGWGNPGDLLCHVAGSLGFYGDCISFQVIFSQLFWLRVLPGGAGLVQPGWVPGKILGGGRTCVSPFDVSRTLPVDGGLFIPCSSPGPPAIKQLRQMVTMVPGQGGQFQVSVLPLTISRQKKRK